MGKAGYEVTDGSVTLDGVDMLALPTWQRAQAGMYLVMQYPTEVPGVRVDEVLHEALAARGADTGSLASRIVTEASRIGLDPSLTQRAVNVDFSGGEKKRNETMQLAVLQPKMVLLDELDSGLDIDALRDCALRVEDLTREHNLGALVITHYRRIFEQLKPEPRACVAEGSHRGQWRPGTRRSARSRRLRRVQRVDLQSAERVDLESRELKRRG